MFLNSRDTRVKRRKFRSYIQTLQEASFRFLNFRFPLAFIQSIFLSFFSFFFCLLCYNFVPDVPRYIICSANSFWTGCVQYSGYAGVMNDSMVPVRFLRRWLCNQFRLVQCDKTSISILLPQYPDFVIITTILVASFAVIFSLKNYYFEKKD